MHNFVFPTMKTYYQLLPWEIGSGSFVLFRALFNGNIGGDGTGTGAGDDRIPWDIPMSMMADYIDPYRSVQMIPHTAIVVQHIVSGLKR